ncbi:MAG: hypothetical protein U0992_15620 [Planctomycetaceae bacterium]
MPVTRPRWIVRRVDALAVVVLLVGYLRAAPFVIQIVRLHVPSLKPALKVIYAPIDFLLFMGVPGKDDYLRYCAHCYRMFDRNRAAATACHRSASDVDERN